MGTRSSTTRLSPRRRFRPQMLGWYPSCRMASITFFAVSGVTVPLWLITRDTVATETPACFATCEMVDAPITTP